MSSHALLMSAMKIGINPPNAMNNVSSIDSPNAKYVANALIITNMPKDIKT